MNTLIETGQISEIDCGSNFAYVLNDNSIFLSTEYKVLQSQNGSCFVKCMKMLYNGKIQLYYLTSAYKSMYSIVSELDPDRFMTVISNLLADIIEVKNNGFLVCQNIDTAFERIYVDASTYKVSLIYLPLGKRLFDSYPVFENELRVRLVKLISGLSNISSPKIMRFASDLSNGSLSMEDLYNRVRHDPVPVSNARAAQPVNRPPEALCVISMNAPVRVELKVTKDEFLIGKSAASVDGVISFNKMISRVHCKINRNIDLYTITDLQSANGTYVNRVRLQPNQPYPIKNGDIIRLANSDFQIVTG